MEEDIKIIENLIKEYEKVCKEYKFYNVPVHIDENDIQALENLLKRNKELEERLNKANKYIESEMYVDDNPTICGEDDDTITELPISLNLYNDDLRKLLELLGGD